MSDKKDPTPAMPERLAAIVCGKGWQQNEKGFYYDLTDAGDTYVWVSRSAPFGVAHIDLDASIASEARLDVKQTEKALSIMRSVDWAVNGIDEVSDR